MNKRLKCLVAIIISLVVGVLLFAVRLTGEPVHMILGLIVIVAILVHGVRNGNRMKFIPVSWRAVDILLLGASVAALVTGMMIHPMADVFMVLMLHKLAAVLMALGCIVHVIQHCRKDT